MRGTHPCPRTQPWRRSEFFRCTEQGVGAGAGSHVVICPRSSPLEPLGVTRTLHRGTRLGKKTKVPGRQTPAAEAKSETNSKQNLPGSMPGIPAARRHAAKQIRQPADKFWFGLVSDSLRSFGNPKQQMLVFSIDICFGLSRMSETPKQIRNRIPGRLPSRLRRFSAGCRDSAAGVCLPAPWLRARVKSGAW